MKQIYLIRHGETEYNRKGIVQGSRVDAPLNDTGRLQATKFYNSYKDIPFDKIYTSVLKRTIESVDGFITKGIPTESYEGLNEISWGDNDGKVSNKDMHEYYVHVSNQWASGNLDLQIGGGEGPREVAARQQPVIDLILSRTTENKILVCMHGRAIRIMLCTLLGKSLTEMDTFGHSNLCLYLLEWDGTTMQVMKANNTDHLL